MGYHHDIEFITEVLATMNFLFVVHQQMFYVFFLYSYEYTSSEFCPMYTNISLSFFNNKTQNDIRRILLRQTFVIDTLSVNIIHQTLYAYRDIVMIIQVTFIMAPSRHPQDLDKLQTIFSRLKLLAKLNSES